MTSAIVLPPLKTWATQRLTALITAKSQSDFTQAFDNFIAKNVDVSFNGEKLTRDQYKQKLQNERFLEAGATVNVLNAVMAPQAGTNGSLQPHPGLVGIFYDATYVETIRIHDAGVTHSVQSSLNIQVEEDLSIPLPPNGIHGDVDRRRVAVLNQVYVDQRGDISATA